MSENFSIPALEAIYQNIANWFGTNSIYGGGSYVFKNAEGVTTWSVGSDSAVILGDLAANVVHIAQASPTASAVFRVVGNGTAGTYLDISETGMKSWFLGMDDGSRILKIRPDSVSGESVLEISHNKSITIGAALYTGNHYVNGGLVIAGSLGSNLILSKVSNNPILKWNGSTGNSFYVGMSVVGGTWDVLDSNSINALLSVAQDGTVAVGSQLKTDVISEKTEGAGVTIDGLLIKDGAIAIDLTSTDTISEKTPGAGVTVDGVLLKDGFVAATAIPKGGEPGSVSSSTSGSAGVADTASRSDHSHDLGAHTHANEADGGLIVAASATQQGAVSTGTQTFAGDKTFQNNVVITGDLTVNGTTTSVDSVNLVVEDNQITVNKNETGSGVTAGKAGLLIERGTAEDYEFIFQESDDTFRVGTVGNTQAVATREDTPVANGIPFWNSAANRMDTDTGSTYDPSTDTQSTTNHKTDSITEKTPNAGVTIDGVVVKDGTVKGPSILNIGSVITASQNINEDYEYVRCNSTGGTITLDMLPSNIEAGFAVGRKWYFADVSGTSASNGIGVRLPSGHTYVSGGQIAYIDSPFMVLGIVYFGSNSWGCV